MRLVSPDAPGARSGIVAFRHPRLSNKDVLAALAARKIVAAVRCGNVRFSAHAYNNGADIDAAIAAIPE
jgi:selenocysteine lyase/cysteine desulfurase